MEKFRPVLKIEDDPGIGKNKLREALVFDQVRKFFKELSASFEQEIEKDPVGYMYKPCFLTLPLFPDADMLLKIGKYFLGLKETKEFFVTIKEFQKTNQNIAKVWVTGRHIKHPILEVHILHTTNVKGEVELGKWAEMAKELGYVAPKNKK